MSLKDEEKEILTKTFDNALRQMIWFEDDGKSDNFFNEHFRIISAYANPNTILPTIINREDLDNYGLYISLEFRYDWFKTQYIAYEPKFFWDNGLSTRPVSAKSNDRDFSRFTHHGSDHLFLFISFDEAKDFIKEGKKIPADLMIQRNVEYSAFMNGFENITPKEEADELIEDHFPGIQASKRAKPIIFIINGELTPFLTFTDLDTDLTIMEYINNACGEKTPEKKDELKSKIIKHDFCGLNLIKKEITCYEQWTDCFDRIIYSL